MNDTSIAVLGGGPGGYVAAIRAAQLGAKVTLIERGSLGGTCLNVGCIPTKSLLHAAHLLEEARGMARLGLEVAVGGVNWNKIQQTRRQTVKRLVTGVGGLMKANGIEVLRGEGRLLGPGQLLVRREDGGETELRADRIILATGSLPALPPIPGADRALCIDSAAALELEAVPDRLVIIGGGVIGVELACAYHSFGARVTVLEALPAILPNMDAELTANLRQQLERRGIAIHTDCRVTGIGEDRVHAEHGGEPIELEADRVLIAVGRRPNTAGIGLEEAGVACERGRILTDEGMETNLPGVYAVGDCASPVMLAHVASAQGEVAAERAMGHPARYDGRTAASCVYTDPELAGVGLTEEAARAQGLAFSVGRFPLLANGKSLIMGDSRGVVKCLTGADGALLGVHILGPRATDLIAEAALAIGAGLGAEALAGVIHPHPSLSEAVREAALAAGGRAIHIPNA